MESVVEVTMTPCMEGSGRFYDRPKESSAHDKCPKSLGEFRCVCACHTAKKRVVRRKARG